MIFEFEIDGSVDDQTQRVILDDKTYEIRFQYNYRDESWSCFLGPVAGNPYCSFKLTTYNDLTQAYKYIEDMPQGTFNAGGYISQRSRIGRYNVGPGRECYFMYISTTT